MNLISQEAKIVKLKIHIKGHLINAHIKLSIAIEFKQNLPSIVSE